MALSTLLYILLAMTVFEILGLRHEATDVEAFDGEASDDLELHAEESQPGSVPAEHQPESVPEQRVARRYSPFAVSKQDFEAGMKVEPAKPLRDKHVLCVIDVQNGYDADFIKQLKGPGGLEHILQEHVVHQSYRLGDLVNEGEKPVFRNYTEGEKKISYDKGWNKGLSSDIMKHVSEALNFLINHARFDLIVYTYDYLDPDKTGVFPLDDAPWSDPDKEVALVPYREYLSITAGNDGTEINQRFDLKPECLKHGPGIFVKSYQRLDGSWEDIKILCFRKQVDDAFDDITDAGGPKNVDPDNEGHQNINGKTLIEYLRENGYSPDEAGLVFAGALTNRCLFSSLVHACKDGYTVKMYQDGAAAASEAEHQWGKEKVLEQCPTAKITAYRGKLKI